MGGLQPVRNGVLFFIFYFFIFIFSGLLLPNGVVVGGAFNPYVSEGMGGGGGHAFAGGGGDSGAGAAAGGVAGVGGGGGGLSGMQQDM